MSSLEQHIDRSRHHRQPRRIVVDYTRPGFVRPDEERDEAEEGER